MDEMTVKARVKAWGKCTSQSRLPLDCCPTYKCENYEEVIPSKMANKDQPGISSQHNHRRRQAEEYPYKDEKHGRTMFVLHDRKLESLHRFRSMNVIDQMS